MKPRPGQSREPGRRKTRQSLVGGRTRQVPAPHPFNLRDKEKVSSQLSQGTSLSSATPSEGNHIDG
jgi:hypothetical protein